MAKKSKTTRAPTVTKRPSSRPADAAPVPPSDAPPSGKVPIPPGAESEGSPASRKAWGYGDRADPELIAKGIERFNGNVSAVAQSLGVNRGTVYSRIKANPWLQELLADQRESTLDELEAELYTQALNGNIAALIFALKTKGAERGFIENRRVKFDGKLATDGRKADPQADAKYLAAVLSELESMEKEGGATTTDDDEA